MKVKIEKLNELKNAIHKNNIEVGYTRIGDFIREPEVGENFFVGYGWRTSTVLEIIDDNTFKTCNSLYRWEKFE